MNIEEMKRIVDRAKSVGLIKSPGSKESPKLTSAEAAAVNGVKVAFMQVTPEMAAIWLGANNTHNRSLRRSSVDAYARDILNGDWLLNHQGIAFDDQNTLIDGQHRLAAIVQTRATLMMLVSTGWPSKKVGARATVMDTVDRGLARTIADQLGLQHSMTDARRAVGMATVLCKTCRGVSGTMRMTTPLALAIITEFAPGIKFSMARYVNVQGLRHFSTLGAIAFAYMAHPKEITLFANSLYTGANLAPNSSALVLRNWLMNKNNQSGGSDQFWLIRTVLQHCRLFLEEKEAQHINQGGDGLAYFTGKNEKLVGNVLKLLSSESKS